MTVKNPNDSDAYLLDILADPHGGTVSYRLNFSMTAHKIESHQVPSNLNIGDLASMESLGGTFQEHVDKATQLFGRQCLVLEFSITWMSV
jgi:hypothetical protein